MGRPRTSFLPAATPRPSRRSTRTLGADGWIFFQEGGSPSGQGHANSPDGNLHLFEGDSFEAGVRRTFTIPTGTTVLSFKFAGLKLDQNTGSINDAFEFALVNP